MAHNCATCAEYERLIERLRSDEPLSREDREYLAKEMGELWNQHMNPEDYA